jgi:hypothetical protein
MIRETVPSMEQFLDKAQHLAAIHAAPSDTWPPGPTAPPSRECRPCAGGPDVNCPVDRTVLLVSPVRGWARRISDRADWCCLETVAVTQRFRPGAWGGLLEAKGVERGQGSRNDKGTSATVAEVAKEVGGQVFALLLEAKGVERKSGARNDLTGASLAQVAKEVGVPLDTAKKRLRSTAGTWRNLSYQVPKWHLIGDHPSLRATGNRQTWVSIPTFPGEHPRASKTVVSIPHFRPPPPGQHSESS